jgi:hypothetical protein
VGVCWRLGELGCLLFSYNHIYNQPRSVLSNIQKLQFYQYYLVFFIKEPISKYVPTQLNENSKISDKFEFGEESDDDLVENEVEE